MCPWESSTVTWITVTYQQQQQQQQSSLFCANSQTHHRGDRTREKTLMWSISECSCDVLESTCVFLLLRYCFLCFGFIDFQPPSQQWHSNWRQWKRMCYYDITRSLSSDGEGLWELVDCCRLFLLITPHLSSHHLFCAFLLCPSTSVTFLVLSFSFSCFSNDSVYYYYHYHYFIYLFFL